MRKRIFEIIERGSNGDFISKAYDCFMLLCIIVSIVPLAFRQNFIEDNQWILYAELFTTGIFIVDYIVRFATEDLRNEKDDAMIAFVKYPFTISAILDLLSILPTIIESINPSFKLIRVVRLLKLLRIFRIIRYSRSIRLTVKAWENSRDTLGTVALLACFYILGSALIIFNVEPIEQFPTFFSAVYWATISLTTVGYGDIYPISNEGKIVAMISSLVGCAVIALPSGIMTAGYLKALEDEKNITESEEY